ncbi:MAG: hypothetical protein A2X94_10260 [Bdellovibrionales bacterium GWB1_55_8]|nr:MAG: hypothetical protein A2X94_10260 [Bdellovibrionales bacterium GWB1_55_8]
MVIRSGFLTAIIAPLSFVLFKRSAIWLLAGISAFMTLYFLIQLPAITDGDVIRESVEWLSEPRLALSFQLDGLSLLFSILISGIGTLIIIYSGKYLRGHARIGRFYSFFFLFMASMLGIVLSNNLILTFIFWELTSIASYFLIGFDNHRDDARKAALQALLVTGAGGLAMLAGFVLLFLMARTYEISLLMEQSDVIRNHALYSPALILITLGAFTKSAQFPFHFWLPNAMQAPTPVSAYLHSATMVKGGIFLLARLTPVLGGTHLWFILLATAGTLTLLTGSFMALQQRDLKLILAYMTVMALGLLVLLLGVGSPTAIHALVVYVFAHSLYKGGLFLIAGNIDHETGTRDIDRLAGLRRTMKWTALTAALCALSMAGFPLFVGFIGKELVYESLWNPVSRSWLLIVATTISMMGLWAISLLIGFKPFLGTKAATSHPKVHEARPEMLLGPFVLSLFGLVVGLAPGTFAAFADAASSAILNRQTELPLAIWHGFNPAFALSAASFLGGLLIYRRHSPLRRRFLAVTTSIALFSPQQSYELMLNFLKFSAERQTLVLQSGSLFQYLLWILVSIVGVLIASGSPDWLNPQGFEWSNILYYEWVLGTLMVLGSLIAARARSPLVSVTSLGVVGYAIALTYVLYGAPDLAMTQFLVETLTVILLALVLSKLPDYVRVPPRPFRNTVALTVSVMFGLVMTNLIWHTLRHPLDRSLSDYFSNNSLPLAHGRNIVNVIIVDFRALDTLGEITVLGIAALGIFGLVRLKSATRGGPT